MNIRVESLQPGDTVMCAQPIYNDGSFPDVEENVLLVSPGQRGVIINIGYIEAEPNRQVYVVRFELPATGELGPGVGCWSEDLAVSVN